jgi:hypothetical protein
MDHRFGIIDGDGKTDALGRVGDQRVDADYFPQDVDQRTAAVAGVDRGIRLDHVAEKAVLGLQGAVFAADHPHRHRVIKAQGISYCDDPFPYLGVFGGAEAQGFQRGGGADLDNGEVAFVIPPNYAGRMGLFVLVQMDLDFVVVFYYVLIGQNITGGMNDKAGAEVARSGFPLGQFRENLLQERARGVPFFFFFRQNGDNAASNPANNLNKQIRWMLGR